jgi:hypothetical protein
MLSAGEPPKDPDSSVSTPIANNTVERTEPKQSEHQNAWQVYEPRFRAANVWIAIGVLAVLVVVGDAIYENRTNRPSTSDDGPFLLAFFHAKRELIHDTPSLTEELDRLRFDRSIVQFVDGKYKVSLPVGGRKRVYSCTGDATDMTCLPVE